MNKTYILLTIVLFTLVAAFGYALFLNIGLHKMQTELIVAVQNTSSKLTVARAGENNRSHEFSINGKSVNRRYTVENVEGAKFTLDDILSKKRPTLVLTYSTTHCSSCIEHILQASRVHEAVSADYDVVILANYVDRFHMRRHIISNKIAVSIYQMGPELSAEIPDIRMPYYFVLDLAYNRINKMFVPQKENPTLTTHYLRSVHDTYSVLNKDMTI